MAESHIRSLARRVAALEKAQRASKRPSLGFSSVEDGAVQAVDDDGVVRNIIGLQPDGVYTVVDLNGPPPPQPVPATAAGHPGALVVSSYGLTVDGSQWPSDFRRIDVHVSATSGFTPSLATRVSEFSIEGGSVTLALDPGTYYVVLVAVSTSGTKSPFSSEVSAEVTEPLQGEQGIPGPPGDDGQSLYTWIKYADSPTSGMSDDPTGKAYLGIAYNKTTAVESTTYADYEWSLVEGPAGQDGAQGIPGPAGDDGQSLYTWIKYADSPTTGMSDDPTGKAYLGIAYNKTTATESTTYADYQWTLVEGPQGEQGIPGPAGDDGQTTYTWIKYADSPTTGMSDDPTGKAYLGIAYNKTTAIESTTYADYQWSLIEGPQGDQGIPGPAGDDGQTTYTWVKYADTASGGGITDNPAGKPYIGLAYNKTTQTESTNPADYQWALIQGPGKIYRQAEPPTGLGPDDEATWYDTDNGNLQSEWDGNSWVPAPLGPSATTADIIAGKQVPLSTNVELQWGVPDPTYRPDTGVSLALVSQPEYNELRGLAGAVRDGDTYTQIGGFAAEGTYETAYWYPVITDIATDERTYGPLLEEVSGIFESSPGIWRSVTDLVCGVVKIGTSWFILTAPRDISQHELLEYDENWSLLSRKYVGPSWFWGRGYEAMNTDGTNIIVTSNADIFNYNASIYIEVHDPSDWSQVGTSLEVTNYDVSGPTAAILPLDTYDFGAPRYVLATREDGLYTHEVVPVDSTGVAQPAEIFPLRSPSDLNWGGLDWDQATGKFVALMGQEFYQTTDDLTEREVWVAYTYYDNVADPDTHESALSPVTDTAITVPPRHGVTAFGSLPQVDDTQAPNTFRIYARVGDATQPAPGAMDLQVAEQIRWFDPTNNYGGFFVESPVNGGAAPPSVSTFPAAPSGELVSELGGFVVRGDGTGSWPYLSRYIMDQVGLNFADRDHEHPGLVGAVALLRSLTADLETALSDLEARVTDLETDAAAAKPYAKRWRANSLNVPHNAWTRINYGSNDPKNTPDLNWDGTNYATQNDGAPGWFLVKSSNKWASLPQGFTGVLRQQILHLDSSGGLIGVLDMVGRSNNGSTTAHQTIDGSAIVWLETGERVAVELYQNTGAGHLLQPTGDPSGKSEVYLDVIGL